MSGGAGAVGNCSPALGHRLGEQAERDSSAGTALPARPLTSRLSLGALPGAVPCARLHTRLVLREWGLGQVADDAETIVSELATNALKASWSLPEAQPIMLRLAASHEQLTIEVWDAQPAPPAVRPHAIDAEAGRGLEIVALLSDRWGFCHPDTGGKLVWAVLVIGAEPGAPPTAGG